MSTDVIFRIISGPDLWLDFSGGFWGLRIYSEGDVFGLSALNFTIIE